MQVGLFDSGTLEKLDMVDACCYYQRQFLGHKRADTLYHALLNTVDWQCPDVVVYGKTYKTPRLSAWYGDPNIDYHYSQLIHRSLPWLPILAALKQELEPVLDARFNSVLLNYYRNGQDGVGCHSDDERELGPTPTIASLSLGATRHFVFRHKSRRLKSVKIALSSGDLLVMSGDTQAHWRHEVPKTSRQVDGRINLTFRWVNNGCGAQ